MNRYKLQLIKSEKGTRKMNKCMFIGRLVRDPDVRYAQTGNESMCVARFTLAVDRRTNKNEADFISCVAFGKNGEFIEKHLKKGVKIGLVGRIQTGSYTNKEGKKVYTTDVFVNEVEFAQSKGQEPPKASDEGFMDIPEGIEESLPFK